MKLAEYVRDLGFTPEQVQDFYPTPSTLSTCMYYTGIHPLTGEKVYVPKNPHEKAIQRALMQYKNPENRELVLEGLKMTGRMDLVGFGPKCLIRPRELHKKAKKHRQGVRHMKDTRKRKIKKGDFGYFNSEKKRRLLITAGLFSLPLLIFFVAWAVNGTRMTVWTVLTVVGCLQDVNPW